MTMLDVYFRYGSPPDETQLRALDEVREVYGIRRIAFDEPQHVIQVEYDASRLSDDEIAFLLRNAGLDIREKVSPFEYTTLRPAA